MPLSTLTAKGQVTIPYEIRRQMGLKTGDRLEFRLDGTGQLVVRPAIQPSYKRLSGMLRHRAKERPVTIDDMRQAVRRRAATKERPR